MSIRFLSHLQFSKPPDGGLLRSSRGTKSTEKAPEATVPGAVSITHSTKKALKGRNLPLEEHIYCAGIVVKLPAMYLTQSPRRTFYSDLLVGQMPFHVQTELPRKAGYEVVLRAACRSLQRLTVNHVTPSEAVCQQIFA